MFLFKKGKKHLNKHSLLGYKSFHKGMQFIVLNINSNVITEVSKWPHLRFKCSINSNSNANIMLKVDEKKLELET